MQTFVVDGNDCRTLRDWTSCGRRRQRACGGLTAARHWAREYGQAVAMLANDDAVVFRRDGERVRQQTLYAFEVRWRSP